MIELINEYKIALRHVNRAKNLATDPEDIKLLGSCADSLSYSIEYMETGKQPGSHRGITRLSSTQREVPVDPRNIAFVRAVALQSQSPESNEKLLRAIDDLKIALRDLTTKEKEAYSLVRANGYSFGDAAAILGIQKGTVQTLVRRAEEKIYLMVEDLTEHGIVFKQHIQLEMF
ncbi:MAG TPA: hypothetical protein DEF42_10395 [Desulfosporosinus sp.]|nr:hypothetical protein [Desulfosporosinus sp.]